MSALKFFGTCLLIVSVFTLSAQKKTTPAKEETKGIFNTGLLSGLQFRSVGPAITSGRIADIAVNP
ncbi:MAG TPA: hypothetical protein VL946_13885, partial [Lacibacter sp.]|nr:hypothetical protein [Lacibacter sp.]